MSIYLLLCLGTILFIQIKSVFWQVLLIIGFIYLLYVQMQKHDKRQVLVFLLVMVVTFGCVWQGKQLRHVDETYFLQQDMFQIIQIDEKENSREYILRTNHWPWTQQLKIIDTNKEHDKHYQLGKYVSITGKAVPITSPQNKTLFNYQQYAYAQGIYHQVFNPVMETKRETGIASFLFSLKAQLQQYLQTFPETIQAYLFVFILCDMSKLGDDKALFINLGMLHLLSVSSQHLQLLRKVLSWLGRIFRLTREQVQLIFLLILYLLALLMPLQLAIQKICWQKFGEQLIQDVMKRQINRRDKMNITCCIAIIFMIQNPYIIYHLGFQYMFVCSLVLLSVNTKQITNNKWLQQLLINVICLLVTLPISLLQGVPIAIFTPVILPIVSGLMIILFLGCWLMVLVPLLLPLMLSYLTILITSLETLNQYHVTFSLYWPFMMSSIVLFIIAVVFVLCLDKPYVRVTIVVCYATSLLVMGNINLQFSSVNLLSLPDGEITIIKDKATVYMIDTGGSEKAERNEYMVNAIILPFLQQLQITQITHLIISHDHVDHIGSLNYLSTKILIENLYINTTTRLTGDFPNTAIHIVKNLQQIGMLEVFPVLQEQLNENNNSLIVYASLGGKQWLFLGDLEEEGEYALIEQINHLPVDIVKIGHHGSRTSSTDAFIKHIQPQIALITVQTNNKHNHPHTEVTQRLEQFKVKYWNTNINGSQHYYFIYRFGFFIH